jgi:hypothetical protein
MARSQRRATARRSRADSRTGDAGRAPDAAAVSSIAALAAEIERRRKRAPLAAATLVVVALAALAFWAADWRWAVAVGGASSVAAIAALYWRARRMGVLAVQHDLAPDTERDYRALQDAFTELRACARCWQVDAAESQARSRGGRTDWKRRAGATHVVHKRAVTLALRAPPEVRTPIRVPSLRLERAEWYFFPEGLVIAEARRARGVAYADLEVVRRGTRFVESGELPSDAVVVDRTWRYPTRDGGPDRRFKDNAELPVALYDGLHLRGAAGLDAFLQFSRADVVRPFQAALRQLARSAPAER